MAYNPQAADFDSHNLPWKPMSEQRWISMVRIPKGTRLEFKWISQIVIAAYAVSPDGKQSAEAGRYDTDDQMGVFNKL